jgi:tol-pal system protein YbgF
VIISSFPRVRKLLPLTGLILFAVGCVARPNTVVRTEIQDLQNRIYELQKRNAESQVEIQELREKEGKRSPGAPGAENPVQEAGGGFESEPAVTGSTIDLGEAGPTRNVESAADSGEAPPEPSGSNPSEQAGPAESAPRTGNTEADKIYVEGYAQFNSGNYDAAETAFQRFLTQSPGSDLADDAQYWMGECYFSRKDYRRAILEFRKVVDQFPFGNRVPHAFLKIGLSYLALGDRDRAAENLETVVQAFPKSDVATVARATLDEIRKP